MSKNSTLFGIAFACGIFALIYGVSIDNAFQRQSAPASHLALGAAAGSLFSSGVAYVLRVSGRPALSSGATFISFFIAASTIAAGGRQAFVRALAGCTAYLPAITTPLLHMEEGTLMYAPAALALAYTLIPCVLVYGELRYRIPDPQRSATAMIIVSRVVIVLAALGLLPLTFIFGLAVIWP